jgi:hypothetical protein
MLEEIVYGNSKNANDIHRQGETALSKKCTLKFSPQTVYSQYRPLPDFIEASKENVSIPILTRT